MTVNNFTNTGFPPKVYLIGALRSGSTYLASLLDKHPKICVSNPKEPGYFTNRGAKGVEWYRARFKNIEGSVLIDATAWYSAAPTEAFPITRDDKNNKYIGVPERINAVSPDAKFLYIVREPVSRIYSLYWFLYKNYAEKRSFRDAIREDPLYLRTSDYFGQIQNFLKFFPQMSIKVARFENLISQPLIEANECFRFLGLEEFFIEPSAHDHEINASHQYRFFLRWLGAFSKSAEMPEKIYRSFQRLAPREFHERIKNMFFLEKPPLNDQDIKFITESLKNCTKQFEEYMESSNHS